MSGARAKLVDLRSMGMRSKEIILETAGEAERQRRKTDKIAEAKAEAI